MALTAEAQVLLEEEVNAWADEWLTNFAAVQSPEDRAKILAVEKSADSAAKQRRGKDGRWVGNNVIGEIVGGVPSRNTLESKSNDALLMLREKTKEFYQKAVHSVPRSPDAIAYRQRQIDVHGETISLIEDEMHHRGIKFDPFHVVKPIIETTGTTHHDEHPEVTALKAKIDQTRGYLEAAQKKNPRSDDAIAYKKRQIEVHSANLEKLHNQLKALTGETSVTPIRTTSLTGQERFDRFKKEIESFKDPTVELAAKEQKLARAWNDNYNATRRAGISIYDRDHPLTKESQRLSIEHSNAQSELFKVQASTQKARQKIFDRAIHADRPGDISYRTTINLTAAQKTSLDKGTKAFSKMVGTTSPLEGRKAAIAHATYYGPNRAYYQTDVVYVSKKMDHVTVVHEFGHWLEDHSPRIQQMRRDFIARRTAGEAPRRLKDITGNSSYEDHEMARPDKFPTSYTGKDYGSGAHSEVISMGLQHIYEQPKWFYDKDPDYFLFMLKVLHDR